MIKHGEFSVRVRHTQTGQRSGVELGSQSPGGRRAGVTGNASWRKKVLNSHLREDPDTKEGETHSKHKNNIQSALVMREQRADQRRQVVSLKSSG